MVIPNILYVIDCISSNISFELIYFHENVSLDPSYFVLHYCSGQIEYYSFEIHPWSWSLYLVLLIYIYLLFQSSGYLVILSQNVIIFIVLDFCCIIYENSDVNSIVKFYEFSAARYHVTL